MKKIISLFAVFLISIFNCELFASEVLNVDRFTLDVSTDCIIGHLWHNTPVSEKDIDKAFGAVRSNGSSVATSSDDESGSEPTLVKDQIEVYISEFIEVTDD